MKHIDKSLGYFYMNILPESETLIKDFCANNNIPMHDAGLHTTIIYDRYAGNILKTTVLLEEKLKNFSRIEAKITGVDVIGDDVALVLLLECNKHKEYYKRLIDDGYKHSYDEYKPHMTIIYNTKLSDIDKYTKTLNNLIDTTIYFDSIKVEFITE